MNTQDGSANVRLTDAESIPHVVAQMTLMEKAELVSGRLPFETNGVERLGIPRLILADGHNGINIFHLLGNWIHRASRRVGMDGPTERELWPMVHAHGAEGIQALVDGSFAAPDSVWAEELESSGEFVAALADEAKQDMPADGFPSCFPTGIVMGATWDPELVAACGGAVAKESKTFGMDVLLGPNVNIHRDPLCGRAFESFSEDPYLSAGIGVGYIRGVQAEGVAAVVKHWVANNQEHERRGIDEIITQRALREIYFPSFKAALHDGDCWMVMSAYNKVNGAACAMNHWLLTDVLRGEWGFDGFVVSDWGAAYERIDALAAGNDLEMPGPCDPEAIVEAVGNGQLDESILDERVSAILGVILKLPAFRGDSRPALDRQHSAEIAQRVAAEGMVLLRNEGDVLPVSEGRVAVFGANATEPIATGTGSAGVACPHVVSVLEGLTERLGESNVLFGELGDGVDVAVICVGSVSGEATDRESIDLADDDVAMIHDVASQCREKGTPCAVVLNVCAPVAMADWVDDVDAVLLAWLAGMEIGHAVAAIVAGDVCPSGKLPLTFPRRYEDTPTFCNFPGEFGQVVYGEGIFVGYRYYDTADVAPLYEFGYGLSYTRFELSNLTLSVEAVDVDAGGALTASVDVTNAGGCRGKEVVQLYIHHVDSSVRKPERQLKGFIKVDIEPGETTTVRFEIDADSLSHYDGRKGQWCVEPGVFLAMVGVSSRDIRATAEFRADSASWRPDEPCPS